MPGFCASKSFISPMYPAAITTKSSLWSSISFMSVSRASFPNWSRSPETRAYASSTKSTPPSASCTTCFVFSAVCPEYPATKLERSASTKWPFRNTPRALSKLAIIRATVVFPVPGLPANTMCKTPPPPLGSPSATRSFSTNNCARSDRTKSFTPSSPTTFSKSAKALSVSSCALDAALESIPGRWLPKSSSPPLISSPTKSTPVSTVRVSLPTVPSEKTRSVCASMARSNKALARCALRRDGSAHRAASATCVSNRWSSFSPVAREKPLSLAMASISTTTSEGEKSGSTVGAGNSASSWGHDRRAAATPSASPARINTMPLPAFRARRSTSVASASMASYPGASRDTPTASPVPGSMRWKSSMSSTPPSAFSHCCATSSAVRPGARPSATRSTRFGRTSGPCLLTSHSLTMCATILASIDLPTPGAPVSTTCGAGSARPPAATRRRFTCSALTMAWILRFASCFPTTRSSALTGSSDDDADSPFTPPELPPAGPGASSSSSAASSTFVTSSTGTKIPNPGLHRNNRSPSYFPSHSLVVRFSSSRNPTTTPPPANSAGPTNITVPLRPPTSPRSPMYTLCLFGFNVAMSSCFFKRCFKSKCASGSTGHVSGFVAAESAEEGTAGFLPTAGGLATGAAAALRGYAGATLVPGGAGAGTGGRPNLFGSGAESARPVSTLGPAFSLGVGIGMFTVTGLPAPTPGAASVAGGLCCAALAPSAASLACFVAFLAAAAAANAAAALGFPPPRPKHTFSCTSFCPRSSSSWQTPHLTSSHGLLLSLW
mmetsp:Transcript_11169/g.36900  ORF Transcript_11169/g.36900 Transcript_11169/m.36900 type:complete len:780 (+) Transcript_11169:4472-6811(+)